MNCRELTELLLDFLNNELPEDFCERIRKHLAECPPCVIYLETYQITVRLSRKLSAPPLPEGLARRLQSLLQQHLQPQQTEEGSRKAD